ncbi:Ig-like domain-containing protein [Marinobacter sp. X15-166B]|uniref:Ig-like domain-containing protein n=1 Tax=Marinobacter sp. X15-166B TaxID=1897620 RepID=UPI0009F28F67|nr:Ig-like domain-containing protein [Marinobacter sp. X15-166B]
MTRHQKPLRRWGIAGLLIGAGLLGGCSDGSTDRLIVTGQSPEAGARLVPVDSPVRVTFSNPIDPATLAQEDITLECPEAVAFVTERTFEQDNRTVVLHPATALPDNETCAVRVAAGLTDAANRPLAAAVHWTFATTAHPDTLALGQQIFRYDTFGDEQQWTDTLRLHEVIQAAVDPLTALAVGLKVDVEALPDAVIDGIAEGTVDLTSPATTLALLQLDAVIGLRGTVDQVDGTATLTRVGITCALCHSTVDDSLAPGIGRRLDGWPNRDLDPGAIIALSPALTEAQQDIYNSWGPGMYDPRFNQDGISSPHVITPAYGLDGLEKITSTGDGDEIAYWNRYVGVTQMGGQGTFYEPRTGVRVTNGTEDLITDKLPALQAYQLSLRAPAPPEGSFDPEAAVRGEALFNGQAQCASCHSGPEFTDANTRLHAPSEVVSEPEPNGAPGYASRTATKMYRTAPLKGLWQHPPYFHNGTAATLADVVARYNERKDLALSARQQQDLVEYLKSL